MNSREKYFSGFITGLITTSIFHPIDALRIRLFMNKNNLGNFVTLYNGFGFNVSTSCIKNMALYPTQEIIRDIFLKKYYTKYESEFYSSFITGIVLGFISTPINTIKIPLQNNNHKIGVLNITKDIYSKYGFRGYYRGGLATLMRDIIWSISYFPFYKFFNDNYFHNNIKASLISGIISMTLYYPFDGIRLYRQNNNKNYHFWYGFFKSLKFNKSNIESYIISLIRIPLSTTVAHMIYLIANSYFIKKEYN